MPILQDVRAAAEALEVQLQVLAVPDVGAIEPALAMALEAEAQALLTMPSPVFSATGRRIRQFADEHRLPTMSTQRAAVVNGSLMAYAADPEPIWRRSAYYVDRILKGGSPADLPVEQPTRFDFVINLKTAQALGITIPQHVLLQATEVIQ